MLKIRENIKPLWILLSRRWGGAEQVALADMADFSADGIPIHLLCLEATPVHAAALRHKNIIIHVVDHEPGGYIDVLFARFLRSLIEKVGPTIIHINDETLLWSLEQAVFRKPQISLVANRHSASDRSLRYFIRGFFLRRLDYMIVSSESIKANVLSGLPFNERKVKVINLGLDFTRFDPAKSKGLAIRERWGADKDTIVIGSVGRLSPEVGQDTFIKAAAGLCKETSRKMKFVIVGEDPFVTSEEYVQELKDLVRLFRIETSVTFEPLDDNLPDIMSAFDIYVMAGREEVPGLGALEALAMERPVVLSNIIGAREIIGNGAFGTLVRPEDAFDLQKKVLELFENPSQRLTMGTDGRQHVLKHYDKKIRFMRLLDIYEKCIKRRFALQERGLSI